MNTCHKSGDLLYDQTIHVVEITEQFRQAGKVTLETIAESVSILHKDGIVVLSNAIDTAYIDHLNALLTPEALGIASDIWANPFVAAISSTILGPQPVIHYVNGNTALQNDLTGRQPVHSDIADMVPVYHPLAYVINVGLVDVTPENGATEIWLGSHHVSTSQSHIESQTEDSEGLLPIQSDALERRRRHSPLIQACSKKGSSIIRDLRLWHAGMPNVTPTPRVMLAFVAQPAWFQSKARLLLPMSVKDLVDSWSDDFTFAAEFVDGKINHKKLSSDGVNFTSGNKILNKSEEQLCIWPEYVPQWY